MKPQKDMFDLFREKGNRIQISPSTQAWDKLERKLDTSRRKPKILFFRSIAFAASFLLLIGAASLLYVYLQPQDGAVAFAQLEAQPMFIEDIQPEPPSAMLMQALTIRKYYFGASPKMDSPSQSRRTNVAPGTLRPTAELQSLSWLLGNWGSEPILESWRRKNAQTLEGKGKIVENGQTVMEETFTILDINGHLVFNMPVSEDGQMVSYLLQEIEAQQAIFTNFQQEFPTTVTLKLDAQGDLIVQLEGKADAPDKQDYLLKRNQQEGEMLTRELERQ